MRPGAGAAAVAISAPGIALPGERKSRPRVAPRARPARKPARVVGEGTPGIALRAIDAFEGVSSSAFLDRLIRGRLWIGLLAFALIGIVAMQLLVLKLNTGIGRTLEHVATLQRENAQLGIEDSTYSAEGRVAPLAAAQGMTLAPSGTVHFVVASKADIARAAAALSAASQTLASSAASMPAPGESSASATTSEAQAQASADATSQASGSSGEASGEGSGTLGSSTSGETAAGSSETSASTTPSATPESTVGPSSQAASAPPTAGAQTGAPATPSSSEATSGTQAGGAAGGTQAGAQE